MIDYMTKSKHEYLKHYYAAHRDILKARMRQYYIKNKDKIKKYQKKYRLENLDKIRKYQREYINRYKERHENVS